MHLQICIFKSLIFDGLKIGISANVGYDIKYDMMWNPGNIF